MLSVLALYFVLTLFQDLSDQQHFEDMEHNPEYDHEAFLGSEDAKTFDNLSPEESKERLGWDPIFYLSVWSLGIVVKFHEDCLILSNTLNVNPYAPFSCRLIYEKIDKDKNGLVSEDELIDWIKTVQNKYITDDTDRQWKEFDGDDGLKWEAYKKRTYGFEDGELKYQMIHRAVQI